MKVSTVIPAYNAAPFVAQCVASALAQQGVESEVVIIDDGSTDGTWEALEQFGDRVRKVRQVNAGPARSRNRGAQLARGEWLAFLDADDEWYPDKLSRQLALADAKTAIVYSDRINFGACSRVAERLSDCATLWEGIPFDQLLIGNFITTSTVIIRRDWFERLGGFDEAFAGCEDWDLWLRCAAEGGEMRVCRDPLVRYRWHPCSISNNLDRVHGERLQVIQRALALPRGKQVSRRVIQRALAGAWECSAWFAAENRPLKAAGWYLRAAWHCPWNVGIYKGIIKCCLRRA